MKILDSAICVVVLGDGDTWDNSNNSTVHFITDDGDNEMFTGGGFNDVSDNNIIHSISVKELVKCWIECNK